MTEKYSYSIGFSEGVETNSKKPLFIKAPMAYETLDFGFEMRIIGSIAVECPLTPHYVESRRTSIKRDRGNCLLFLEN